MKKIASILTALTLALSLAACGTAPSSKPASVAAPQSQSQNNAGNTAADTTLTGKITVGGSTSMEKVIGALSEAFMEQNKGVTITFDPTGSGAGITGALEGTLDIGLSSRDLKDTETGLVSTQVALDGIAIVVNTENPVKDLTLEQIKKIATGEITNWKDLGGNDGEIVFIGREAGSGTRDGFESIVDVKDACKYSEELTATGAVIGKVQANANAIGYASLASVDEKVKAVTVGGVAASEATVLDGSYKIQRPFIFVTKEGAELSAAAQAFMDFATSAEAAEIISNAGAVPSSKA